MLLNDMRKVTFLKLEVSVLRSQFSPSQDLSDLVIADNFSHFAFLCCSAGQELLRRGRQVETLEWLRGVVVVDREYQIITGIRDASVKLLIEMAVKNKEEEADVMNMVELSCCPLSMTSYLPVTHSPRKEEMFPGMASLEAI